MAFRDVQTEIASDSMLGRLAKGDSPIKRFFTPKPAETRFRDVMRELPGGFVDTGVDIFQGIARSGAGFGLDLMSLGQEKIDSLKIDEDAPEAQKAVQQFFFGKDEVKSLSRKIAESELSLNEFVDTLDLDEGTKEKAKKASLPLSFIGGVGLTALDFTGIGGANKTAINTIIKTTDKTLIKNSLKLIKGLDSKALDDVTKQLVDVTDEAKAAEIIRNQITKGFDPKLYVGEQVARREAARPDSKLFDLNSFAMTLKKTLVDSNAPIEDAIAQSARANKFSILPQGDVTNQIDRVLRAPMLAGQFVKDNGFDKVIKNVPDILEFEQYLIAKQARAIDARGFATGRDLVKDSKLVASLAPRYEQFAKQTTQYSQKLLDYLVSTKIIDDGFAKELKQIYPDYVPMNRVLTEVSSAADNLGNTQGIANMPKQTIIQKLKGSELEVESPLESLLVKTYDAFVQGEKNMAAKMLGDFSKTPGGELFIQPLKKGETAKHTISYIDGGVKKTFKTTEDIERAAKRMGVQQLNILGQVLAFPVRVAKLGITGLNVAFGGANLVRDQVFAAINSNNAMAAANPKVFMQALFEAVGHKSLYEDMVRQAGAGTSFDIARNQPKLTVDMLRAQANTLTNAKFLVTNPKQLFRAVEDIFSRPEELTRMQQFIGTKNTLMKSGVDRQTAELLAGKAARENSINFLRKGEWGTVLNSAFLYLNAGIQGARTVLRSAKTKPVETAIKISTMMLMPTAMVSFWNMSDPERREAYFDILEFEKENNLIIVPPNPTKDEKTGQWNVIKIPTPPGLNNLNTLLRRNLETIYGNDPMSFQDAAAKLIGTVSPVEPTKGSIFSTLTPQIIRPAVEAFANINFFTGIPQVPQNLQELSPELQVKDKTSGTAVKIGNLLNYSPIKVEELIKGYGGGVASQVLNLTDRALAGLNIIDKNQIGGKGLVEDITRRFSKVYGGASDDEAVAELQGIIQNQSDERFRLGQEAELLYNELKLLSKDEANRRAGLLKKERPDLFEKLKRVTEEEKRGLDYQERLILRLGVENGERAKFIMNLLERQESKEEKNNLYKDLKQKRIISANVDKQLRKMIRTQ